MKIKTLFCVIAAAMLAATPAFAAKEANEKDHSNKDENGKIVRGPYLTNNFGDNWFIGLGAGFSTFSQPKEGFKVGWTEVIDANFGKWFAPEIGARLAYQGFRGQEKLSTGDFEKFKYAYVHGDVLFNFSHIIGGYRTDRFWNFVPYVHLGYLRLYDEELPESEGKANSYDNEIAGGIGLLNQLRLAKHWNLTLDGRMTAFSGRFHSMKQGQAVYNVAVTVGVQYLIGKCEWSRGTDNGASAAALAAAKEALEAAKAANKELEDNNNALANDKDKLAKELEDLKNRPMPENTTDTLTVTLKDTVFVGGEGELEPLTLYFDINSYKLNFIETERLGQFIEAVKKANPDAVFTITGCADLSTGSKAYNLILSGKRISNTIEIMKNKYGVPADKLKIGESIVSNEGDPRLSRSVKIEF